VPGEQQLQRIGIATDKLTVEDARQLVLLRASLTFEALAQCFEGRQLASGFGTFGAELMQAPVDGGDRRFGFPQLVGRVVLGFLGGRHVAAQRLDAALQILQFALFGIDTGCKGGRE
jgi:hypothetical protein